MSQSVSIKSCILFFKQITIRFSWLYFWGIHKILHARLKQQYKSIQTMDTRSKACFLFYLITKLISTVMLEDSSHKKLLLQRAQYHIKRRLCTKYLNENFHVRTQFCIASSPWPFRKSFSPASLYWQFFPPYSHIPLPQKKKAAKQNNIKTIHKSRIIFISFIQEFFTFFPSS